MPSPELSGNANAHFLGRNKCVDVVASAAVAIEAADARGDAASLAAAADRGSNT